VASISENVPRRRVAPLLVLAAGVLVFWALVLAYRLPARHTTYHWDVAWVGFDIALAVALATTGWGIVRHASWAPSSAAVAATLLLCDAWFDTVLANGRDEQVEAVLEAALVEIPLAILCLWLAGRGGPVVGAMLTRLRGRAP
jgi:uncharacterized membrane protein